MAAHVNLPRASDRGHFAELYRACDGCGEDLLDIHGTGAHPTDWCERRARRNPSRTCTAPINLTDYRLNSRQASA